MYKVFIVEDDQSLQSLMKEALEQHGYEAFLQTDFKTVTEDFIQIQPDLVLLDIHLPYYDGYFLCHSLRKHSNVPIIMISAKSAEVDQVMAIEYGADDYITKPFTFDILLSKVKATIRRVYGEYAKRDTSVFSIVDLSIDSQKLTMSFKQQGVELSKNEYKLMKKFMENNGTFLPREQLIEEVWDNVFHSVENTLKINIDHFFK
ncbi:response regulator transcription factor [Halalkalibacter sp. APA_J-10(15)]|uniref:response regulator transcription factor n=1 Tax=Halalkalibacter sp. APA_J-10(15) TaxID=2933805 RepID=UPI001FF47B94|nr:response regulator transcription factor [Halalkalibacter sp. APA_J-10(15)]MCK0473397.1 response regulator transcription factor [Halalkalibacter sp. APA_J-10(15)]